MESIKSIWKNATRQSHLKNEKLKKKHPKYVSFKNHFVFILWRCFGTVLGWGCGVVFPYDYITRDILPSEYRLLMTSPKGLPKTQIQVMAQEQYIDRYRLIFFTVLAALCAFATIVYLVFNRKRWSYKRFAKKHPSLID